MTSPIYFNVPEARDFLLEHQYVYTIRKQRKDDSNQYTAARWGSYYDFHTVGKVRVHPVLLLHEEGREVQLCDYVRYSGFHTVQEWLSSVKEWKHPMMLYRVELVDGIGVG